MAQGYFNGSLEEYMKTSKKLTQAFSRFFYASLIHFALKIIIMIMIYAHYRIVRPCIK